MGTIADLRRRAQRRTDNLYDTLFTRRVSIYVTAVCYALGLSANAVSMLNVVVGLTACVLIALGTGWQIAVGIALVHLFAVLDSVDGELARLRQRFSLAGLFLEDLAAYTMINGMFLAVGWYVQRTTGCAWPFVLAIIVVAIGRNAMQVARRAVMKSIATRRPLSADALARHRERTAGAPSSTRRLAERVLHYTNVWLVMTTMIALEELGVTAHLVMYTVYVYGTLVLVKEAAVIATYLFTDGLDRMLLDVYDRAGTLPTDPVPGVDLAGD